MWYVNCSFTMGQAIECTIVMSYMFLCWGVFLRFLCLIKEFCCQQSISCTTIPKNHLTYSLLAEMQCFKALWTKRPGKSWSHYIALARRCVPPKLTLVGVLESFFFRSLAKMQIAGKIAILWIINDHLSEK